MEVNKHQFLVWFYQFFLGGQVNTVVVICFSCHIYHIKDFTTWLGLGQHKCLVFILVSYILRVSRSGYTDNCVEVCPSWYQGTGMVQIAPHVSLMLATYRHCIDDSLLPGNLAHPSWLWIKETVTFSLPLMMSTKLAGLSYLLLSHCIFLPKHFPCPLSLPHYQVAFSLRRRGNYLKCLVIMLFMTQLCLQDKSNVFYLIFNDFSNGILFGVQGTINLIEKSNQTLWGY